MVTLLLDCLAAYRLTRLVTTDGVLSGPREWLLRRAYRRAGRLPPADPFSDPDHPASFEEEARNDPHPPKAVAGLLCAWCVGVWASFGVVAARRLVPRAWEPVGRALAIATTVGLVHKAAQE